MTVGDVVERSGKFYRVSSISKYIVWMNLITGNRISGMFKACFFQSLYKKRDDLMYDLYLGLISRS